MSLAEIEPRNLSRHYRDVRLRLVFPPNAREDFGIDLKRKPQPASKPDVSIEIIEDIPVVPEIHSPVIEPEFEVKGEAPEPIFRFPKIRTIQRIVAEFYRLPFVDMVSERRFMAIVRPRQIAMYLCRHHTPHSYPYIGRWFGGRDHTTILHALSKIAELRTVDREMDDEIRELDRRLAGLV